MNRGRHMQDGVKTQNGMKTEDMNERLKLLGTLLDVSNLVSTSMELRPLLEAILDRLRTIIDYSGAGFFILQVDSAEVFAYRGGDDTIASRLSTIPLKAAPLSIEIIRDGKPVLLNDIHDKNNIPSGLGTYVHNCLDSAFRDTRALMGLPLIVKDRVVGVLILEHSEAGYYKPYHIETGMAFANQAAIEYENARLYAENARMYQDERRRHLEDEQRRYVAEGLRDILAKLNSNSPLEEILEYIIKEAIRMTGSSSGALYRLEAEDDDILVLEAACGLPDEFINNTVLPVGTGAVGKAVKEKRSIVISDMDSLLEELDRTKGFDLQAAWLKDNCRLLLAIPLISKDRIYGGIALYFREPKAFEKEDIEFAAAYADQAALAIANASLRAQAEEMAVAAERNRLARDLHDAVTQTLFSASIIADVVPRLWERNQAEGMKRLEELRRLTRGALAEMRTLLFELRPSSLTGAALEDLLKQQAEVAAGHAGIPVSLEVEGKASLPEDVKIVFYRIAQEALNNISKHSEASLAGIVLKSWTNAADGTVGSDLYIRDDGRGFDPNTTKPGHLGLGIMKERAESVGAVLRVGGNVGEGTEICIVWAGKVELH